MVVSINLWMYQSIYGCINQSMDVSINLWLYQSSMDVSINLWMYQSIYGCINQSMDESVKKTEQALVSYTKKANIKAYKKK